MTGADRRGTRAERLAMPLARNVVKDLAAEHGACQRPVQLRRTEIDTGYVEQVLIPCGHTLATVCPPCAERARILRATQCREGWHLDHEPVIDPDPATGEQRALVTDRAEMQADRDALANEGLDAAELDERIGELDEQITDAGMRGNVLPNRSHRHRSTKRRQDAAPLPRRPVSNRTVGKTYTTADGKTFRPSLFVTLTCPSYGRVGQDGAPADPDTYNYTRAARDALHFAALFDRFIQNLRRLVGYDLQYFAVIEPQKRLAPHVHIAIRGTITRAELREVIDATYHQVWWPTTAAVQYDSGHLWITPSLVETRFSPDALVWVTVVFHGTAAWRNHGLIIFPLLFYRTSVQLRCPAAPPGGGLRPPGRPPGLGHLLVGHPGFALRVPRAGRG